VSSSEKVYDVVVVGAGPIGIACGVEASQRALSHVILEKGCMTHAIYRFPISLVFFSTPELLAIGNIPFLVAGQKPTRVELLKYYKAVAQYFNLNVSLYEEVTDLRRDGALWLVRSKRNGQYRARFVVLAIGFYDHPNMLGVPGEDLPKVSHYYTEPHPYFRQKVAVIGAENSAVEAALELYRYGADVTLIHRGSGIGSSVKYWIRPDIENRIKEGSIKAYFHTTVQEITEKTIVIRTGAEERTLENDAVLAMTGYHVNFEFLRKIGVELQGEKLRPAQDPETMETNLENLYIAGVASGGLESNRIFIENGREHAKKIMRDIKAKLEGAH